MKVISIAGIKTGVNQPCVVVAEIGAMYEDIYGMKKLIKAARDAGADAVKIQTYRAETISLPEAEFEFEDGSRLSQYDFFKKYEISPEAHRALYDYAEEINIPVFSTPSYYDDVDFLEDLGVPAFKVGSDDLTNLAFLQYIANKGKPVIISTGMSTLQEVREAVDAVFKTGNDQVILLHCTTAYPPEPGYANLNIIRTLQAAFDMPVGYSDHIPGIFSSVLAAGMGACMVEKHVTLDRNLRRPDYQIALEPCELKEMVEQIRLIPVLQGESIKKVFPPEKKWRLNARKSLIASRNVNEGSILQREDIKVMRPGTGIQPGNLKFIVGRRLKRPLKKDELIPEDAV